MAAGNFDAAVTPAGWFSRRTITPASWFDRELIDGGGVSGSASITFAPMTTSAAGQVVVQATASITFAPMSISAAGQDAISGAAAINFAPMTTAGAGVVAVTAAAAIAFAGMSTAAAGTVQAGGPEIAGTASITFAPMTTSAAGQNLVQATASITFAPMSVTAAGVLAARISHKAFATLGVSRVTLKAGDLEPELEVKLVGVDGSQLPLAGAAAISFRFATTAGVEKFVRTCALNDAATGSVSYIWLPGDTNVPGEYYGEFVVDWGAGRVQTCPVSDYILIVIEPKL